MERFKKRTIALVLASVVTVAGSFAAENYKNSLMSLKFDTTGNGNVSMSVETRTAYSGNVSPVRRDANTYVLTLSEMNSKMDSTPNLEKVSGDISSVEIKTLPYSPNAKGYTRVIIRTNNPINISSESKVYIPAKEEPKKEITTTKPKEELNNGENLPPQTENEVSEVSEKTSQNQEVPEVENQKTTPQDFEQNKTYNTNLDMNNNNYSASENSEDDSYHKFLLVLSVLCAIFITIFLAMRALNKIHEVTGEKFSVDTSEEIEEQPAKPEGKRKQIQNAIEKLDKTYAKTAVRTPAPTVATPAKQVETSNIIDLDELFKEQKEKVVETPVKDIEENDALAEFLSGFSFEENEEHFDLEKDLTTFDEELYDKIITNDNISFSEDDIDCMTQLLSVEVDSDILTSINEVKNIQPEKPVTVSKEKILENLLTTYKLAQDIIFSTDDVKTLRELMNVEIDKDFITNLRTNSALTKKMQQDIETAGERLKKTEEETTLSVKDLLPNLSEELKKQGDDAFQYGVKPSVVYASEGYQVDTLSLKNKLPDLSKELKKKNAHTSKPSAAWDLVDNSYKVDTLKLTDELPDLSEALKHPERYERKEEVIEVDEDALLRNLSNVQFKPFDDGTAQFEILNDFSSEDTIEEEIPFYNEAPEETPVVQVETPVQKVEKKYLSKEIEDKIQKTRAERIKRKNNILDDKQPEIKCIIEGETFTVVSSAKFSDNKGCHLAKKDDNYTVLGYINDKFFKVKEFETLRSERIHARLSEKLPDGIERYLVRIGTNKFILSVTENNIEYVMAL